MRPVPDEIQINQEYGEKCYWYAPDFTNSGPCVYDKGTNTLILIDLTQKRPVFFIHQDFRAARGIISKKKETVFWIVSRCGCSSILGTVLAGEIGSDVPEYMRGEPARIWCYQQKNLVMRQRDYIVSHPEEFKDFRNVTVYCDPYKRFANIANYFSRGWSNGVKQLQPCAEALQQCYHDREKAIWHVMALVEANLYNKVFYWDSHVSSCYRHYIEMPQIDTIVPLGLLDIYFEKELGLKPQRCNMENTLWITEDDLNEEMREKLSKLWADDLQVPNIYADKFYTP